MSNSTDKTGCISHRANSRFFIMYEDYLEVAARASYGHRHKLAAFWRILETKTNDRTTYNEEAERQGLPKLDMWVEIPYSECVNRSLETFKSSSFQVAAAESERLGFSKSRARKRRTNPLDPQSPLEDYKEYFFLSEAMQIAINGGEHPTPIENNSPLLKSLSERKEKRKKKEAIENNTPPIENNSPGIENNRETPIEINSGAIEINNKKDIKDTTKDNKDTEVDSFGGFADATPPTPSNSSLEGSTHEDDEDQAEDDDDTAPTVKMPAIPKKPTPSSPAQVTPPAHVEAEPEQDAPGQDENETQSQLSTPSTGYPQPEQQALMVPVPPRESARQAPKWNEEAMVALAEKLRGRAYSKITRPKEIKAAEKVLKRKPDSTSEEFESVFVDRNDPWWREHCGLLNVTDLAAVPKDKNDMRYMLIVDKLEREAARPQESETKKPAPRRSAQERVISSFGTPGFDFAAEFYPSEGEKRRACAVASARTQEVAW
ncbi:MAG: hypothetical protein ACJ788_24475 [Ktedonobacteraceae bacterium]